MSQNVFFPSCTDDDSQYHIYTSKCFSTENEVTDKTKYMIIQKFLQLTYQHKFVLKEFSFES